MNSSSLPSAGQLQAAADAMQRVESIDLAELQRRFEAVCSSLPLAGLVPAGFGLLVGLLLWWFGERFLRLALMLLGIFVGVPLGMGLAAAFAPALPPVAAACVGAVVLMVVAAIGLRFAVAGGLAILLGVAGVLGSTVAIERGWVDLGEVSAVSPTESRSLVLAVRRAPAAGPERAWHPAVLAQSSAGGEGPEGGGQWAEIRRTLELAQEWISSRWSSLPRAGQTLVAASGAVGALLGLGFGIIFRRPAMRVATALLGSLLILSGGSTLLAWAFPEWAAATLPGGPWLALWGVLAVVGAMLQWKRRAVRADNG